MTSSVITVLGAGYVGLTTAALLARSGFTVYVIEPNTKRLDVIKQGRSFFYEAGLDAVIADGLKAGTFIPTDSYDECIPKSDIVFSCVGTPDNPDGSSNLSYVFQAAEQAAPLMKDRAIYVQKSTVPVGTGARIEALFADGNPSVPYVSNPEFLREGSALEDTLYFDRIVAGGSDRRAVESVLALYRQLEQRRDAIAALANITAKPTSGEYIATELASAELIKVTANAFLALKISFANSIATLADKAGADVVEVLDAVGADARINRAFFNAGRGYGGGCFPKDVSGLIASGLEHGVELELMQATQAVNARMPGYIAEKLQATLGGSLKGTNVAVLGLAFKAGTSDARRSPGIALANLLQSAGAVVSAFDPKALNEARETLLPGITLSESLSSAVTNRQVIVVATEWPEFIDLPASKYRSLSSADLIVDAVNRLPKQSFIDAGFRYLGVGR